MKVLLGYGDYKYEYVRAWGKGPEGRKLGVVSGQASDSRDRLYVVDREPNPAIVVFDREGGFLNSWGEGLFSKPHDIWVTPDDKVYVADCGDHTVRICTTEGEVLNTLGTPGTPGEPGMPFNQPTRAVGSPSGEIFVSDGYGQHRVHRFSAEGKLINSWGEPGPEPGKFGLVHSVFVDQQERVWIADREPNHCIQVFDVDGNLLDHWKGRTCPCGLYIDNDGTVFVAEGWSVTILTSKGEFLSNVPLKISPDDAGHGAHSVWVDSRGDLYVGEVGVENLIHKYKRVFGVN
jgi:DNA-binding beta-propeller fold protein YncE